MTNIWSRFPTSSLPIHGETVSEVVEISVGIDVLDQPDLITFSTISSRIYGLEVGNRLQFFVTSQTMMRHTVYSKGLHYVYSKEGCYSFPNSEPSLDSRLRETILAYPLLEVDET